MIKLENITKTYNHANGVKHISFTCPAKSVTSVIGPNGAGKSTILKLIAGLIVPDEGKVTLDNNNTGQYEIRKKIGFMPEKIETGKKVKLKDFFHILCDLKYNGGYREDLTTAVKRYQITDCLENYVDELSLGTRRKIAIILAFLGNPDVIILDEPTNGVDTQGIITLKEDIAAAREREAVVLISSHILDFVGTVADQCVFLKNGGIEKIVTGNSSLEDIYRDMYIIDM